MKKLGINSNGLQNLQPILHFRVYCKKNWILFLLIMCAMHEIHFSQSGYNQTYDLEFSIAFKHVTFANDELIIYGNIFSPVAMKWNPFVAALDTHGNINRLIEISGPDKTAHAVVNTGVGICSTSNSGIAVTYTYLNRDYFCMAIIDSSDRIDIIQEYDIGNDKVVSPFSIIQVSDGGYMITGWASRANFNVDAFVLKANNDGEKEWMKYYGTNHINEQGLNITQVHNNKYVIGGKRGSGPQSAHIFAIDSSGTLKWQWTNEDPEVDDRYVFGLNRDVNNDWVYLSWKDRLSTYPHLSYQVTVPIFVRRDSLTNLKVYKELGPFAIGHNMVNMVPSRDGWIVVGNTTMTTDSFYSPLRSEHARIMKLSKDGDVIWSVQDTAFFTPGIGSVSEMSGVVESTSGSVYAVGYANKRNEAGFLRSYGWLLKITADGCVDTICTTTSLLDQIYGQEHNVTVYPNPTTDYLIFEIDEDIRDDIYAETYDLSGKQIQSQRMRSGIKVMMLDEGSYAPGMYVWRVVTEKGVLIDAGKFVVMKA